MKETTQFRNPEETHELCDPLDLNVEMENTKLIMTIEKSALFKFEPKNEVKLSFSYHLKLKNWTQNFYYSSKDFGMENHPKLWQTLMLKTS
ncbi:MAG: hypothetical protein K940chlam8_01222 [Chlamydiae bacterium]|nr:hypothetical protein [Chlamydiota bacterium]